MGQKFLSDNERKMLREWNSTEKDYPRVVCLHELIEAQVRRSPDSPAVRFGDRQLSFAELNQRANRCARYLRSLGAGPDSIVGVLMERSLEMVTALLGILKAGAAYLPLDPTYPPERLQFMLEDAGVSIILAQEKQTRTAGEFKGTVFLLDSEWDFVAGEDGGDLERMATPENLAYVIYTSGSTGKPKGCMVPHKAICNRLLWMQDEYLLTGSDRVLQKTPFTFDVSVWEFFWPLLAGACLVMAKPEGHKDNNYLIDIIRKECITTCHFVPSMLRYFVSNAKAASCDTLRQVFTSGEALPYDLAMDFKKKLPAGLHNLYGPTEAAVDVTYWECGERPDKKVPIGRPISNIQMYILDGELNQVPIGYEGELHIGGIGLARGYLNRPELTSEKFINNPFSAVPGDKLYKTGDKARYLPDGNIEYLGRMDFQVKLRGNRIELGEIETTLREHNAVEEAVVLVRDEESGDPKLVAYLVPKGNLPPSKELRTFIKSKLPEYMAPNIFVALDSIPITQHGKLDRKALPWPVQERTGDGKKKQKASAADREQAAGAVLGFFKEVLHADQLGTGDDLFDAGATSLTMAQIVEKIEARFKVTVPLEVFLEDPTVDAIAAYISRTIGGDAAGSGENASSEGDDKPRMHQPQGDGFRNIGDLGRVIELSPVEFREAAYAPGALSRRFAGKTISFKSLSRFLSLLRQETIQGNPKYLYPSAGGLNAVQTYLFIKENSVDGIGAGTYYYHPEKHALCRIDGRTEIDRSIFFEYDRDVFDRAGFVLFFVAQMNAIRPVYQFVSPTLVTLDAGYMGQMLMSRQTEAGLGLRPAGGVDFDRISSCFKLDEGHRFVHCMLAGVPEDSPADPDRSDADEGIADYLRKTGKVITEHIENYRGDRTFAAFLDVDVSAALKETKYLNKEEHDQFHAGHCNIRRFSGRETVIALDKHAFPESDYLLRSCKRDYMNRPVPFAQFSKFIALLKPQSKEGRSRYLYPSVSGLGGIQVYLYIKQNGVEGLSEGIYYYHPGKHVLALITSKPSKIVKTSYTPFNRKHYQKSAFCLYLIAQLNALKPIYGKDSLYVALLEAGYMGQLLMDRQAEFDLGVCPIGGLNFDRIRQDFRLDDGHVLIHSFTCGSFEMEMPAEREYLETARGAAEKKASPAGNGSVRRKRSPVQHDIAIVGVSGRYPGARTLDEYWENLKEGKGCFRELPEDRRRLWGDRNVSLRGALLDDIDCFDNLLFNISPPEARSMDPQERLFMETAWECLENAGYTAENLKRAAGTIGVFAGAMWSDYQNQSVPSAGGGRQDQAWAIHSSIANRASHFFNFSGPSVAINTSCASAMTAIHFACESIKRGECDAALVGGVNLIAHPSHHELLAGSELLSKDGECRPFGAQATGWVAGEGVGAILIRPIEDAERDRDHIHGVIKGTAIGHSGKTARFGSPNPAMQADSIRKAITDAGVTVQSIQYIEAAAPGAALADASEINALKKTFHDCRDLSSPRLVGTVKANIGHLESASAMSQLTKVLFQLKHGQVAPAIHSGPTSPLLQLEGSGIQIADRLQPWPGRDDKKTGPARALINAFGATGSGGHIIVEEYARVENRQREASKPVLIPLSAATPGQLKQQASRLREFLTGHESEYSLRDIAFTLSIGRVEMEERLAVVASTTAVLNEKLGIFLQGGEAEGLFRGTAIAGEAREEIQDTKDLLSAAALWTRGAGIAWSGLHDGAEKRVPLPNYPFAKERHWVLRSFAVSGSAGAEQETAHRTVIAAASGAGREEPAPASGVEEYLKTLFSAVSEIPVSRISARTALEKYGISSLMITTLNQKLEQDFGELPKTLFFEYQTIRDLAGYFVQYHHERSKELLHYPEPRAGAVRVESVMMVPQERQAFDRDQEEPGRKEAAACDIAIIGLSGRYPKSRTIAEFWENLKNGVDCITEIPRERWDHRMFYDTDRQAPGKAYSKWGGFIDDVDKFDPLFFNISPLEAGIMDPQERLFLETAWHAIEDAGYNRSSLKKCFGSRVGVFAGTMYGEYQLLNELHADLPAVCSYGSIANRVSYFLDFQGPSMAVDTMCSSSLTAIHLAVESIRREECTAALAGGLNISLHPYKYVIQSKLSMSSSDGRCRSFGEGGDGFVPGEGVGAVFLKPLEKAIRDGDHIYGIIKATSINHGGKTNGYTVPNPGAQGSLISEALKKAKTIPRTISYVEAHGTGTSLGDPIEIAGLSRSFGEDTNEKQYCSIGSAKSNIGHLEAAAGIAGLTKVLLQMKHKKLAPSLHSQKLNENISFERTPFFVQQSLSDWNRPVIQMDGKPVCCPRRACLSSFGAGGANAHVVIEEFESPRHGDNEPDPLRQIILFSAKNEERLREQAQQMLDAIRTTEFSDDDLIDIAYTLQTGREAMEERLAMIAGSLHELEEKLRGYLDGRKGVKDIYRGRVRAATETLAALAEDEEMQETIEKWARRGKYAQLLDLWVKGLNADWEKVHSYRRPRRISLPVYPFARERYWIRQHGALTQGENAGFARLHPLVHENTSDFLEQRFSSTFTGREFFLADHIIQRQRILPAVAHLEMARIAAGYSAGAAKELKAGVRLRNIVWARPIAVNGQPVSVHIGLSAEETGEISYEIYGAPDGNGPERLVYSQGSVLAYTDSETQTLDLAALRSECSRSEVTADRFYEVYRSIGFEYGPAHRCVEQVYPGQGLVLAKLVLPFSASGTADQFALHPGMIDSALQACVVMSSGDAGPAIPFAVRELEILGNCTPVMWAVIRHSPGSPAGDKVQKFDIDVCDEQGTVRVRFREFSSRVWERKTGSQELPADTGTLMLEPVWKEKPAAATELVYDRHVIMLCEPDGISADAVQAALNGSTCLSLRSDGKGLEERYQDYAHRVFEEIRNILEKRRRGKALVQIVVSSQKEKQLFSGLSALLRTARFENPQLTGQLIETEPGEKSAAVIEKLKESGRNPDDAHILYKDGKRLIAGWNEIDLRQGEEDVPWKNDGVYLITGGAGGLGQLFAKEIARHAEKGAVILTGRTPLDESKQARLAEVPSTGARVEYLQTDVTREEDVDALIRGIRERYGKLNGIIHAAGIIRDNFILRKTGEELQEVLAPKVRGLVFLDEASKDMELDLFVSFSSIAGSLGNPGQADYAAANAFMDAYARYRNALVDLKKRKGRTLSIGWPLWKQGGMRVSKESEQIMTQATGITAMDTATGLRALYQGLASCRHHVLVLQGDVPSIRRIAGLHAEGAREAEPAIHNDGNGFNDDFYNTVLDGILNGQLSQEQLRSMVVGR